MKGAEGRGKDETESCGQKLPLSLVLICFALSQPSLLDGVMTGVGGTICDVQLERRMLQTVSECRGRGYSYPSASNLTSWIFIHLSRSPKAHLSQAGMSRSEMDQGSSCYRYSNRSPQVGLSKSTWLLVGSEGPPDKATQDVSLIMLLTDKLILDAPSCEVGSLVNPSRMITWLLLCDDMYSYLCMIPLPYISFGLWLASKTYQITGSWLKQIFARLFIIATGFCSMPCRKT